MNRHASALLLLLAAFVAAPGGPAAAAESAWAHDTGAAVRLLSAGRKSPGVLSAGVQIRLEPGYKTYWRYAGDSGVPPHFDWTGSDNLAEVRVRYPAPHAFVDGGGRSLGYKGEVVFPLEVVAADPARPVRLKLDLDYAVCEKICVPAKAAAELVLDPGAAISPSLVRLVDAHDRLVPKPAVLGGSGPMAIETARVEGAPGAEVLAVRARAPAGATVELGIEAPEELQLAVAGPQTADAEGVAVFRLPIGAADKAPGARLALTLGDGKRAIEVPVELAR